MLAARSSRYKGSVTFIVMMVSCYGLPVSIRGRAVSYGGFVVS